MRPKMRDLTVSLGAEKPTRSWCRTCDPGCPQFSDSDGAKRHALNNPGHAVVVEGTWCNVYRLDPEVWS